MTGIGGPATAPPRGNRMSALDHFMLAELLATPTGEVQVRALASGLRQGRAVGLANARRKGGSVQFVASARLRSATVVLPTSAMALGLGSERALETRFAQWLEWLRAHGVLRLAELEPGRRSQWVTPRWLADPLVSACLGIVLNPAPAVMPDVIPPLNEWLDTAPPASIAGLLRDAGRSGDLINWLEQVPAQAWEPLQIPLLDMQERADGPLHIGWWTRTHRSNPYALGEVSLFRVSASGWLEPSLLTVDRGATPWPARVRDLTPPPDQAFRFIADPRLDQLFNYLPGSGERLLAIAAYEAKFSGADAETIDEGQQRFAGHLESLLAARSASMTVRLLQRAWPVPGAAPTLKRSRYLHGGGNVLVRQRRHELAELAPELAMHAADGYCPGARAAIDAGRPLLAPLAADWEVPMWAARRTLALLRQVNSLKETGIYSAEELAKYLAACGPHAPAFSGDDLRFLAELSAFVPDESEGPNALAMLRASGREAAVRGWEGVCEVIEQYDDIEAPYLLLAWWDVLRDNVRDVLARCGEEDPPNEDEVEAVFASWLQSVPLSECMRLALDWSAVFWGHDRSVFASIDVDVPKLFDPLSLCESRVEVLPLTGHGALQQEAREMLHCVASYHLAVVTGAVFVVSLTCPLGTDRATAALTLEPGGTWTVKEASGPGNRTIASGSRMSTAIAELLVLLHDTTRIDPAALAFYRQPATTAPRPFDHTVGGRCLISRLPKGLAEVAARCFPGDGPVDRRILRAAQRVIPQRLQAN